MLFFSDGDFKATQCNYSPDPPIPFPRGKNTQLIDQWLINSHFQHQQQVATAVERAKQVTMTELNAIIGVRVIPIFWWIVFPLKFRVSHPANN